MKVSHLFFLLVFCFGCSKSIPRRPINPKPSSTITKQTVALSVAINKIEEDKIRSLIEKDSTNRYLRSSNGFWYTYLHKIEEDLSTPKVGQDITLEYNIKDLEDAIIYSKEELGVKKYIVDKQDFISAIQQGIKLMKIGETITFVIPSYNAFGISGDGNKIGINQSIKSTVTLININK